MYIPLLPGAWVTLDLDRNLDLTIQNSYIELWNSLGEEKPISSVLTISDSCQPISISSVEEQFGRHESCEHGV